MSGAYLAAGINPGSGNSVFANMRMDNSQYNNTILQAQSGPLTTDQFIGGLIFTIPAGVTAANLRAATLQLCGADNNDARNDSLFDVYAEKVANSAYWNPTPSAGGGPNMMVYRWTNFRTTAKVRYSQANQAPLPQIINIVGDDTYTMADVLKEVMAVSGWATGNRRIALFLKGFTNASVMLQRFQSPSSPTTDFYGPRLSLSYGDISTDAIDFDLGFVGNSHPAFFGHAGQTVNDITVGIFGSTTLTGPIGLRGIPPVTIYGTGDNHRGFEPNGVVQNLMEAKWGQDVDAYRAEFAVGGSTCAQWAADVDNLTSGKWGDITKKGSMRNRLANPLSPSKRQVWVGEMLGNDTNAMGPTTLYYCPPGSDPDFVQIWEDLWTNWINDTEVRLRKFLDHFWECAGAVNPDYADLCYLYIVGLPRFPLKWSGTDSPVRYFCNNQARDLFRSGAGIQGQGWMYKQIEYDAGINRDTGHYGRPELSYQSAAVQAAARYQQVTYPTEAAASPYGYNPSGAHWSEAVDNPASTGRPSTWAFANSTWQYPSGTDRWEQGLRHVNDINFNRRHEQMLQLYERVLPDYPNLIYVPTRQMMGIDTTYSADPTSDLAQSPGNLWIEGIHPTRAGIAKQFADPGNQLDQMARAVPFMQPLSDMFTKWNGTTEEPIHIQGIWDGSAVQECHLDGVWNGTEIEPAAWKEIRAAA